MSRSRKQPWATLTKAWTKAKEKKFRKKVKQACHEVEIDFDPDADFDELNLTNKGLGDYGTRNGWHMPPHESDDTWDHEEFEKLKRK